jgi:DNA-binding NarL/FixJ family response regulator
VKHTVRILLGEDFKPWRRFVVSLLQKKPEWQIVGETSDGLEAVQKAKELRPDLILLDIGLPKLNGIEAARQIRRLTPESRIIFVSQESSADVVAEALSFGAQGYVLKIKAGGDLLIAMEAVLEGKQFISCGLNTSKPS